MRRHLHSHQHAPVIGTVVAVMKQADVPVRAHAVQELHQRTRPFREFEAVKQLVVGKRCVATHEMANVEFRHFVVGKIQGTQVMPLQHGDQFRGLLAVMHLDADKDVRFLGIGNAVVEFGDVAFAQQRTELLEAAGTLRNGHRENGFAFFAKLGVFRYKTQPVEIHVGAAGDRNQGFVPQLFPLGIGLGAGNRQRACRLQYAAGILEHILDRCADGVGVHQHHLVHILLAQAESFPAHFLDRDAVGK